MSNVFETSEMRFEQLKWELVPEEIKGKTFTSLAELRQALPEDENFTEVYPSKVEHDPFGILSGFVGVGGAFIVTPAQIILGFPAHFAVGTSLTWVTGNAIIG